MTTLLPPLDIDRPILAAPMAGGASTPALVTATARAGGLGFLAGGYKSAQALAGQIHTVESEGRTVRRQPLRAKPRPRTP